MSLDRGRTGCMHETEFLWEERKPPTGRVLRWYRCKHCGQRFTEKYPTIIVRPPGAGYEGQ